MHSIAGLHLSEPGGGRRVRHTGSADNLPPLGGELTWLPVHQLTFTEQFKPGRPPSLRLDGIVDHVDP